MFIPVGDTPNPRNFTPWVNWFLIGANIAVYVFITLPLSSTGVDINDPMVREYLQHISKSLPSDISLRQVISQISAYNVFTFIHGYKPGAPQMNDLLFSIFLHGGLLHLAGNMLFLWIYGDNVEHRLGRFGYLMTYLCTGICATLFFSAFAGDSMIPLVGASGAISGILGLYFLLFPRNSVKVFIMLFPIYFNVILLPARWVLGFYVLVDNVLPFVAGASSSVAYGAHIGGFLAGLGIAWTGERFAWHWPWKDTMRHLGRMKHDAKKSQDAAGASRIFDIQDALKEGSPSHALELIANMSSSEIERLKPDDCIVLAGWLDESGHPIAASRLLKRCLSIHTLSNNPAEIYLALGLLRLKHGQTTAAYQHLLSVFDHNPSPDTAQKTRNALARINMYRGAP
ncbi:MAG TPA: rhomboid family intramembrane serine protease [Deltaproteobacteria bacterium]|nr:rhomboid family intramembrane serine protease [Deltaproteobacteria bacterium]